MTDSTTYKSYSQLEEFLLHFYSLIQNTRIHSDNHALVIGGVENFYKSMINCLENDALALKISNDQLFVDGEKLPYNKNTKNLFDNVIHYFDTRNLEGMRFLLCNSGIINIRVRERNKVDIKQHFRIQAVPDMWQARFGPGITPRAIVAFIGGTVAMFGARLAGG